MWNFSEPVQFVILSFWSLFVIVDPVGAVPTFLAMTPGNTQSERIRMARLASIVTFFVLFVFALGGEWVIGVFGVGMPAFEIAGGIVLLKVALDMLQARQTALKETPEEQAEGANKEDVAITPLAIPMLAGPGAITAVVLLSAQGSSFFHRAAIGGNIFLVSLLTFLILRVAAIRSSLMSAITLKIISRLMGLLLAAIAIQFVLDGVRNATQLW
ncbi:MAG: NAAT family transporter [Candidatus Omnitrophica bacterium]|nr:NAAT family transporter [Candidatus Omnitrophota bacterium]